MRWRLHDTPASPDPTPLSQSPTDSTLAGKSAGPKFSITIVGDLRVDVNVQLGSYDFGPACSQYTAYREVSITPGGTALSMCRAFAPYFNSRHVVSALGMDSYSDNLRLAVNEAATSSTLQEVDTPNGTTIALFCDSETPASKSRFSVASPRSPYLSMDPDWIHENLPSALGSDMLTMDCLLLASPDSSTSAHLVAQAARSAGCLLAIDVVPHNIIDHADRDEVLRLLFGANLVTVELGTLAQMFGTNCHPTESHQEAERLYNLLKPHLAEQHWVVIRFGSLSIEYSIIYSPDGPLKETDSGPAIRAGGYPSGSEISGSEYKFILSQWKH
nr:PfkB family carbohydrate kinase [Amycolatopsis thailandensis]